jgi:hypothetical protein
MPTFNFPDILVVENLSEQGIFNLRSNPGLLHQIQNLTFRGVVLPDGNWAVSQGGIILRPDDSWTSARLDVGKYSLDHGLGYTNMSINVALLALPGSVSVTDFSPRHISIETSLDGVLTDMAFSFTLMRTISPNPSPPSLSPPPTPSLTPLMPQDVLTPSGRPRGESR